MVVELVVELVVERVVELVVELAGAVRSDNGDDRGRGIWGSWPRGCNMERSMRLTFGIPRCELGDESGRLVCGQPAHERAREARDSRAEGAMLVVPAILRGELGDHCADGREGPRRQLLASCLRKAPQRAQVAVGDLGLG